MVITEMQDMQMGQARGRLRRTVLQPREQLEGSRFRICLIHSSLQAPGSSWLTETFGKELWNK